MKQAVFAIVTNDNLTKMVNKYLTLTFIVVVFVRFTVILSSNQGFDDLT